MIVSFHPMFEADCNILYAGRRPTADDLAAIQRAEAVILPQGCDHDLYAMARQNCPHVFPNYDARFGYPGKIGQARLFETTGAPHPQTIPFASMADLTARYPNGMDALPMPLPLVFKFDWGGEGDYVFLIRSGADMETALEKARAYERSGQCGFLLQAYVPSHHRALRVVVIGQRVHSYWRIQAEPGQFRANLKQGAIIDPDTDPELQAAGKAATLHLGHQTGINLAGFDLLFDSTAPAAAQARPLFLEINYFFGRRGLGGSEAYYGMLQEEIRQWLATVKRSNPSPTI